MFDCMEGVAEKFLRYSAYRKMSPLISDMFRNVLQGSFHTFEDFIDGMWEVVSDIEENNKCLEKSNPMPKQNSGSSNIPEYCQVS